jgi:hypothetical protein
MYKGMLKLARVRIQWLAKVQKQQQAKERGDKLFQKAVAEGRITTPEERAAALAAAAEREAALRRQQAATAINSSETASRPRPVQADFMTWDRT